MYWLILSTIRWVYQRLIESIYHWAALSILPCRLNTSNLESHFSTLCASKLTDIYIYIYYGYPGHEHYQTLHSVLLNRGVYGEYEKHALQISTFPLVLTYFHQFAQMNCLEEFLRSKVIKHPFFISLNNLTFCPSFCRQYYTFSPLSKKCLTLPPENGL